MPELYEKVIDEIIRVEGSQYTNHPADRGGPTKFGITLATLRSWRKDARITAEDVKQLTVDEARRIYYDKYIAQPGFVHIYAISPEIGVEMIDSGVNAGPARPTRWLQESLNAFNRDYRTPPDYPEVVVDGKLGPATISALQRYLSVRGKAQGTVVMVRALNVKQGAFYLSLAANDKTQETFTFGWFANRVS